jgi:hypothetical protein
MSTSWNFKTVRFGMPNSIDVKIWSQLDPRNNPLTRLKIKTVNKNYRSELRTETNAIVRENRDNFNRSAMPWALLRMELKKADEFAAQKYSLFRDVWLDLGGVETAAFIRTISCIVIQPAFDWRRSGVAHAQRTRFLRSGGLLPALPQEKVCREFDQLKSDWRDKLEMKALEREATRTEGP